MATTGTILALPPVFGHDPAGAEKSWVSVVDPLEGIAAKPLQKLRIAAEVSVDSNR